MNGDKSAERVVPSIENFIPSGRQNSTVKVTFTRSKSNAN